MSIRRATCIMLFAAIAITAARNAAVEASFNVDHPSKASKVDDLQEVDFSLGMHSVPKLDSQTSRYVDESDRELNRNGMLWPDSPEQPAAPSDDIANGYMRKGLPPISHSFATLLERTPQHNPHVAAQNSDVPPIYHGFGNGIAHHATRYGVHQPNYPPYLGAVQQQTAHPNAAIQSPGVPQIPQTFGNMHPHLYGVHQPNYPLYLGAVQQQTAHPNVAIQTPGVPQIPQGPTPTQTSNLFTEIHLQPESPDIITHRYSTHTRKKKQAASSKTPVKP